MRLFISLFAICCVLQLRAQVLVEGFVRDELGQAISFAHVALKHHELEGVVSKVNGFFAVEMDYVDTLVFSHIGFKSLELPADSTFNDRYISVTLPADFVQLEAVWVLANEKYKVPIRNQGQAYDVSGVEKRSNSKPIKAGSLRGGASTTESGVNYAAPSLVLHGPITFFEEREARKAARSTEETAETFTFRQFVNDGDVRDSLMVRFDITNDELSNFLLLYNQQFQQAHTYTNTKEIWSSITAFIKRQKAMQKARIDG